MTPEQMMAAGWKVFDFSSSSYNAWQDEALQWIEQNWTDYPIELVGYSCDGYQCSFGLACYWAVSPATRETLQSHIVGLPEPPIVSIGEVTSQTDASTIEGDGEEDKPSGVNPLGGIESPINFGGWTLPKWLVYVLVYFAVRWFLKGKRQPPKTQKLKRFFYKFFAW